jgi:Mg-chelatase subunit ChlD
VKACNYIFLRSFIMKKEFVTDCGGIDPKTSVGNNATELVFILDKSGSMVGMEKDTIGGFNAMIERQKALDGEVYVSTVLFSSRSEVLHDRKRLEEIQPLTEKDYRVGGGTALLDAIGRAISHIGNIHKYARKEDVPARTLFVITTDGMENASRQYNSRQIKDMVRRQEEKYGWEFLFLAANIDAVETAEGLGIREDRAVNYCVEEDTDFLFSEVGELISECREVGEIPSDWCLDFERKARARRKK